MYLMVSLSLLLNIVVLVPVCWGIIGDASWVTDSYGEASAARSILLSIYLSIGAISALLLVFRDPKIVAALLIVQVTYKFTTPITVGTMANPIVTSNLLIAIFHLATLVLIWRNI